MNNLWSSGLFFESFDVSFGMLCVAMMDVQKKHPAPHYFHALLDKERAIVCVYGSFLVGNYQWYS